MKLFAKVFSHAATVFTVLALLTAIGLAGPRLLGLDPYIVESGSMEPTIHTGSIAYINTRDTKVVPGDIVTFRIGEAENEKLVTHRIRREENGQFITKGDANDEEDFVPVSRDQIVGTFAYSIPKAGFVLAKKKKLLPVLIAWIIGLNLFSILTGMLSTSLEDETM